MKEKVILQVDVDQLGLAGEKVDVAKGYARNYLVPKKLALPANPANEKKLAAAMATVKERKMRQMERAKFTAEKMEALTLTIPAKVGEEGRLFGSVTSMDLAEALAKAGHEIDRKRIDLKAPLKVVGEFEVPVRLEAGVVAQIKVSVVSDAVAPVPEPAPEAKAEAKPEAKAEEA